MMKVVLSISITVVVLCALYAVLSYQLIFPFEGWTRESLGQFGDSWGGLTSIFSAAAFCGVLWTIKLQKDSMIYLEEESRKQHESDIVRDFENSFFNMV
ncbi:hypothetical protein NNO04_14390, partial [Citrobacter sp. Awk 4]|uniref:hypothetical protein n=1 Tax=Citrobacter sp. Awk 4 TaxID=2963955 RepID=UPI00230213F2